MCVLLMEFCILFFSASIFMMVKNVAIKKTNRPLNEESISQVNRSHGLSSGIFSTPTFGGLSFRPVLIKCRVPPGDVFKSQFTKQVLSAIVKRTTSFEINSLPPTNYLFRCSLSPSLHSDLGHPAVVPIQTSFTTGWARARKRYRVFILWAKRLSYLKTETK